MHLSQTDLSYTDSMRHFQSCPVKIKYTSMKAEKMLKEEKDYSKESHTVYLFL